MDIHQVVVNAQTKAKRIPCIVFLDVEAHASGHVCCRGLTPEDVNLI